MRRIPFIAAGLLALAGLVPSLALAASACPAAAPAYQGVLFDAMAQIESTQSPQFVLDLMRAGGVEKMALFARVHPKRSGEHNVLQAGKLAPDRILMGTPKTFDERDDLRAGFVKRTLEDIPGRGYRFVGEIMFTHGDKSHGERTPGGERYVDPLAPGVNRLVEALKGRVPFMTHWEVYDWDRDWPRVSQLYARFPAQTFIWPHVGFAHVAQVDEVLSRHSNVVATLSKKEQDQRAMSDNEKAAQLGPAIIDDCGTLLPEWKDLILRHQDRLLFATDAHKEARWNKYRGIVKAWRGILGQLPPAVAEKIALRNALRVYAVP